MGLAYRHLDLAALVRLTAGHFDVLAGERGIRFLVQAPETLQAQVDGDKVQRVLLNLLSNAFKFTPDRGIVRSALTPGGELVVEDSGPGIAPAMRQAVFDRFRQGDGGPTRRFGGTGLGLAIARDFVELHGGSIEVADSSLGGARFTVRLPLIAPAGALVEVAPGFTGQPELVEQVLARVANLVALKRARDVLREEVTSQSADVAALARELAARSRELREAEATAREQRE
jgi:hypothetical protein